MTADLPVGLSVGGAALLRFAVRQPDGAEYKTRFVGEAWVRPNALGQQMPTDANKRTSLACLSVRSSKGAWSDILLWVRQYPSGLK